MLMNVARELAGLLLEDERRRAYDSKSHGSCAHVHEQQRADESANQIEPALRTLQSPRTPFHFLARWTWTCGCRSPPTSEAWNSRFPPAIRVLYMFASMCSPTDFAHPPMTSALDFASTTRKSLGKQECKHWELGVAGLEAVPAAGELATLSVSSLRLARVVSQTADFVEDLVGKCRRGELAGVRLRPPTHTVTCVLPALFPLLSSDFAMAPRQLLRSSDPST